VTIIQRIITVRQQSLEETEGTATGPSA